MQKTRSGLAAVAAKMQLTDAPEGKSSLQSRLNEAERRAHDAEASAQDAQAALARTLLEAAHVESVVTARIRAQSDAEIAALRSELAAMKRRTPAERQACAGQVARPDVGGEVPLHSANGTVQETLAEAAPQARRGASNVRPDMAPDTAEEEAAPRCDRGEKACDRDAAPEIRLTEFDLPVKPDVEVDPEAVAAAVRFAPSLRLAFLSVFAVVAVMSYLVTSYFLDTGSARQRTVASMTSPAAGQGLPTDRTSEGDASGLAAANATVDEELARLQRLSRKVAALKTVLAERRREEGREGAPAAGASQVRPDTAAAGANWLLYMPIEKEALVQYLAGRTWPGMQIAAQGGLGGEPARRVRRY